MDSKKVVAGGREALRRFDAGRRIAMLKVWEWIGGSPQKAGWTALALAAGFFLLGRWSA